MASTTSLSFHTTDDLFATLSVPEIRRVLIETASEANARGAALRELFGERYGDLISTADEAADMFTGVRKLEASVDELRRAARTFLVDCGGTSAAPHATGAAAATLTAPSDDRPAYEILHASLDDARCLRASLALLSAAAPGGAPLDSALASSRAAVFAVARRAIAVAAVGFTDAAHAEGAVSGTAAIALLSPRGAAAAVAALTGAAEASLVRALTGAETLPARAALIVRAVSAVAHIAGRLVCGAEPSALACVVGLRECSGAAIAALSAQGGGAETGDAADAAAAVVVDGLHLPAPPYTTLAAATSAADAFRTAVLAWVEDAINRARQWLPAAIADWQESAAADVRVAHTEELCAAISAADARGDGLRGIDALHIKGVTSAASEKSLGDALFSSALATAVRAAAAAALAQRLDVLGADALKAAAAVGSSARVGALCVYANDTPRPTRDARDNAAVAARVRRKLDALHKAAGRSADAGAIAHAHAPSDTSAAGVTCGSPAASAASEAVEKSALPEILASGVASTAASVAMLVAAGALRTVSFGGGAVGVEPTESLLRAWAGSGSLLAATTRSFPCVTLNAGALSSSLARRAAEDAARGAAWLSPIGSAMRVCAELTAARAAAALGVDGLIDNSRGVPAEDAVATSRTAAVVAALVEALIGAQSPLTAAVVSCVGAAEAGGSSSSRSLSAAYEALSGALVTAALSPVLRASGVGDAVIVRLARFTRAGVAAWAAVVGSHAAAAVRSADWGRGRRVHRDGQWRAAHGAWASVSAASGGAAGAAADVTSSAARALSGSSLGTSIPAASGEQSLSTPQGTSDALVHAFARASAHVARAGVAATDDATAPQASPAALFVNGVRVSVDSFGVPLTGARAPAPPPTPPLATAVASAIDDARALAHAAVSAELRRALSLEYEVIAAALAPPGAAASGSVSRSDEESAIVGVDSTPAMQAFVDVLVWGHALPDVEAVAAPGAHAAGPADASNLWVAGAPRAAALMGSSATRAQITPVILAATLAGAIDAVDFSLCGPALVSAASAALRAHAISWSPALPPRSSCALAGGLRLSTHAVALSTATAPALRKLNVTWRIDDLLAHAHANAPTGAPLTSPAAALSATPLPVPLPSDGAEAGVTAPLSPPLLPPPARVAVPAPPSGAVPSAAVALAASASSGCTRGVLAALLVGVNGDAAVAALPPDLSALLAPPVTPSTVIDTEGSAAHDAVVVAAVVDAPNAEARFSAVDFFKSARGAGGALLGLGRDLLGV